MALKKYILTIEFDDNGDNCEYIQEEIIDDTPEETKIIYEARLDKYFSDTDIACLTEFNIGKSQQAAAGAASLITREITMDVWSLEEKYKKQAVECAKQAQKIQRLEDRLKHLEDYLSSLTKANKGKDEKVQNKKSVSSSIRSRRRITAKS